jgi:hypothetical protein
VAFSSFISNCFDALSAAVVSAIQILLILLKLGHRIGPGCFPSAKKQNFFKAIYSGRRQAIFRNRPFLTTRQTRAGLSQQSYAGCNRDWRPIQIKKAARA